jgi:hypothetical protein
MTGDLGKCDTDLSCICLDLEACATDAPHVCVKTATVPQGELCCRAMTATCESLSPTFSFFSFVLAVPVSVGLGAMLSAHRPHLRVFV